MEDKEKNKPKVSKKDFILMLVVAIFFDVTLAGIQLIPFAGSVAASVFSVIPFMSFFIWYKILDIDFVNPKKAFTFFGCSFIEFIPGLNAFPAWTLSIIIMYILQKKDVILAKAAGVVGGVAGASAVAGKVATAVGAKEVGKSLKETSGKLKEKSEEYKNRITPLQNQTGKVVGGEISKPTQQKSNEPGNVIPFENNKEENFNKTAPFSNAKPSEPHSEDWIFPNDKAA